MERGRRGADESSAPAGPSAETGYRRRVGEGAGVAVVDEATGRRIELVVVHVKPLARKVEIAVRCPVGYRIERVG